MDKEVGSWKLSISFVQTTSRQADRKLFGRRTRTTVHPPLFDFPQWGCQRSGSYTMRRVKTEKKSHVLSCFSVLCTEWPTAVNGFISKLLKSLSESFFFFAIVKIWVLNCKNVVFVSACVGNGLCLYLCSGRAYVGLLVSTDNSRTLNCC